MMAIELRCRLVHGVISTDDILPARYKHSHTDPAELSRHLFEHFLDEHARTFRAGDCLVSDSVFGIGSSREQSVATLLAAGIRGVVAPAFGRIFYRNAWNLGLLPIELALPAAKEGDIVEVDLDCCTLTLGTTIYRLPPVAPEMLAIYHAGGLLALIKQRMEDARWQVAR
jgi:3-isopropylmalate/(R)-2-methylmalate dehydratase small subunit